MKAVVGTTPTDVATVTTRGGQFTIQNTGAVDVYLARAQEDCNADDFDQLLPAGMASDIHLEGDGYADDHLWAVTASGTSELHFLFQR